MILRQLLKLQTWRAGKPGDSARTLRSGLRRAAQVPRVTSAAKAGYFSDRSGTLRLRPGQALEGVP